MSLVRIEANHDEVRQEVSDALVGLSRREDAVVDPRKVILFKPAYRRRGAQDDANDPILVKGYESVIAPAYLADLVEHRHAPIIAGTMGIGVLTCRACTTKARADPVRVRCRLLDLISPGLVEA
jgi:hypothetical protein